MKNYVLASSLIMGLSVNLYAQKEGFQLGNVKPEMVKQHELAPQNIKGIKSADENGIEKIQANDLAVFKSKVKVKIEPKPQPAFDANYFAPLLHEIIKDKVMGYMCRVFQNGQPIITLKWNFAKSPADGNKGWNENTTMHIASVSKLMTGIGMVKLLDKKGITLDTKIINYLPDYWQKGSGVDKITFKMLLNHSSGFGLPNNSQSDFAFMKSQVKSGPSDPKYANMNFGLMRILISVIDGRIPKSTTFPIDNDKYWDIITTTYFLDYMNKNVFSPAGVGNVSCAPDAAGAFAYKSKTDPEGWNSGDLKTVAGGAGLRMSVDEVMKVVDAFRRKNNILPSDRAKYMLDNGLGNNGSFQTSAGKVYYRKGAWISGGQTEQSVVLCLPDNVNIVVFVNSPIGSSDDHISKFARAAVEGSIY